MTPLRKLVAVGACAVTMSAGAAALAPASAHAAALVATTTTVTTSRPVATYFQNGTVTATVKSAVKGQGIPTGSVDFQLDGGYFWTQPLDATGKAKITLRDIMPSTPPGTYAISAIYSGDTTFDTSVSGNVSQTFNGITTTPVTTLSLNATGKAVLDIRSFTLSSWNPVVGCNVNIFNNTPINTALAYGTPGNWKALPGGGLAAGATRGVGVGLSQFTGYFTTRANLNSYVAIHCV